MFIPQEYAPVIIRMNIQSQVGRIIRLFMGIRAYYMPGYISPKFPAIGFCQFSNVMKECRPRQIVLFGVPPVCFMPGIFCVFFNFSFNGSLPMT